MAFPSSNGSRDSLGEALIRARAAASAVKRQAQNLRTSSAAGPTIARSIVQFMDDMTVLHERLTAAKNVPGLLDYAKAQYADTNIDISAEFVAMQTEIVACITWIATNIPKDSVSGRWLLVDEVVNGKRVDRTLSVAATAGLRTALDLLLATID